MLSALVGYFVLIYFLGAGSEAAAGAGSAGLAAAGSAGLAAAGAAGGIICSSPLTLIWYS